MSPVVSVSAHKPWASGPKTGSRKVPAPKELWGSREDGGVRAEAGACRSTLSASAADDFGGAGRGCPTCSPADPVRWTLCPLSGRAAGVPMCPRAPRRGAEDGQVEWSRGEKRLPAAPPASPRPCCWPSRVCVQSCCLTARHRVAVSEELTEGTGWAAVLAGDTGEQGEPRFKVLSRADLGHSPEMVPRSGAWALPATRRSLHPPPAHCGGFRIRFIQKLIFSSEKKRTFSLPAHHTNPV